MAVWATRASWPRPWWVRPHLDSVALLTDTSSIWWSQAAVVQGGAIMRYLLILLLGLVVVGVGLSSGPTEAAFPGGNGKIAFHTTRDTLTEIYTINSDGSGLTRLTNNAADDQVPAWSPDGSQIAFASSRDGNEEIYVMNSNGSGQTPGVLRGVREAPP